VQTASHNFKIMTHFNAEKAKEKASKNDNIINAVIASVTLLCIGREGTGMSFLVN
jgi:hypothetical protein